MSTAIHCPGCGLFVSQSADACPHCGERLSGRFRIPAWRRRAAVQILLIGAIGILVVLTQDCAARGW